MIHLKCWMPIFSCVPQWILSPSLYSRISLIFVCLVTFFFFSFLIVFIFTFYFYFFFLFHFFIHYYFFFAFICSSILQSIPCLVLCLQHSIKLRPGELAAEVRYLFIHEPWFSGRLFPLCHSFYYTSYLLLKCYLQLASRWFGCNLKEK